RSRHPARDVEGLLARVKPGMAGGDVVAILGPAGRTERFTRTGRYDGPPSTRPVLWDRVAVGTTVVHWLYPDRKGIGVVAFDAAAMKVIARWFLSSDRPVSYG